jgi:hypothetical protein
MAYDRADTIAWLEANAEEHDPGTAALLTELTSAFELQPWTAVGERLSSLESRLRPTIQVGPNA